MEFKPKVAMLDDEEIFLDVFSRYLKKENFQVRTYKRPSFFLKHFEREYNSIDGILLDGRLNSNIDGIEVLKRCRGIKPQVTTVLMSQYEEYWGRIPIPDVDLAFYKNNNDTDNFESRAKEIKELIINKNINNTFYRKENIILTNVIEIIRRNLKSSKTSHLLIAKIEDDTLKMIKSTNDPSEEDINLKTYLGLRAKYPGEYLAICEGKLAYKATSLSEVFDGIRDLPENKYVFIDQAKNDLDTIHLRRPRRVELI